MGGNGSTCTTNDVVILDLYVWGLFGVCPLSQEALPPCLSKAKLERNTCVLSAFTIILRSYCTAYDNFTHGK